MKQGNLVWSGKSASQIKTSFTLVVIQTEPTIARHRILIHPVILPAVHDNLSGVNDAVAGHRNIDNSFLAKIHPAPAPATFSDVLVVRSTLAAVLIWTTALRHIRVRPGSYNLQECEYDAPVLLTVKVCCIIFKHLVKSVGDLFTDVKHRTGLDCQKDPQALYCEGGQVLFPGQSDPESKEAGYGSLQLKMSVQSPGEG